MKPLPNLKKTKKSWKKWLKTGILLFAIHQGMPYVAGTNLTTIYNPSIKVGKVDYSKRKKLPLFFSSLDYLNLSNDIVHNEGEGSGNCKDYSLTTYKIYQTLIKLNNREDLEDKVRFVVGEAVDNESKNKSAFHHAWLEIKRNGEWQQYETTLNLTHQRFLLKNPRLNRCEVYNKFITTYPGTNIPLPTLDRLNPLKGGIPAFVRYVLTKIKEK